MSSSNEQILSPTASDREVTGLFDTVENLDAAVRELESSAFPRDSISILGSKTEIEKQYGTAEILTQDLGNSTDVPHQAPPRPEEKTIGSSALVGCATYAGIVVGLLTVPALTVPATIAAVVLGGGSGAALGGLVLDGLHRRFHADHQRQIENGGLILWVKTPDQARELLAMDILTKNSAHDVKSHFH